MVKDNRIVGRGGNQVIPTNDPTAHAEIIAIRDACRNLGSYHLCGAEIYTSCEPCPHVPGRYLLGAVGTRLLRPHTLGRRRDGV